MLSVLENPSRRLNRQSLFSFECGRCSLCCSFKKIQVNPYEIARLAANLKITTSDVIRSNTSEGVYLKTRDDGQCVFLESGGCSVHPDRPLVCRLYPLGRRLSKHGEESFIYSNLHPECRGTVSYNQTIEEYMTGQGAHEFLYAGENYRTLLKQLVEVLGEEKEFPLPDWISVSPGADMQVSFPRLLDPDWVIENVAEITKEIRDPWQKMKVHIRTIEDWIINRNHKKEWKYENRG
jgi:uncharacterized protein